MWVLASATREKWLYANAVVKVTNAYKYLGMIFTAKLSVSVALSDVCRKGKKGVMEIQKSMRRLSTIDPCVFWKIFERSNYSYLDVFSRSLGIT